MGSYHQHLCAAEAYKTRAGAFRGRELRHLVTSKAGHNQAGGGCSFLSAASCRRYTAGCGGGRPVSRFSHNGWWKRHTAYFYTIFFYFAHQKTVERVHWWRKKRVFFDDFTSDKTEKIKGGRGEIYFSPWPAGSTTRGGYKDGHKTWPKTQAFIVKCTLYWGLISQFLCGSALGQRRDNVAHIPCPQAVVKVPQLINVYTGSHSSEALQWKSSKFTHWYHHIDYSSSSAAGAWSY